MQPKASGKPGKMQSQAENSMKGENAGKDKEMKKNVNEIIRDLKAEMNDISIELAEYYDNCNYICDAISECADSNVSIYYSDIERFMSNNIQAVNDAIDEFGWDGCGSDLHKAGQMAEYLENERLIYEDLEEVAQLVGFEYFRNVYGEEITKEQAEAIEEAASGIDHNDSFDIVRDAIDEFMTAEEEAPETLADIAASIAGAIVKGTEPEANTEPVNA